ncbi:glycosyl transferase family 1 [candidate division WOR_3 bacterium SM23_42]|uniref:Glycosyl transferase family 1 n=1 Tax=candidate division WOR_3 bacterium SM23_42 TaxID=1703779 RepID=A0A0S8FVU2_UNCW3|nr:MAG: glycosyl transferase family 1 [candidate division WOR_3 bacterium SM23_42]
MKRSLNDYRKIVGDEVIGEIYRRARKLYGKTAVHVNSTYYGGGVAEILSGIVPLMNDIGIAAGWRMLRGTPDFFNITKKFHNALQGNSINLTEIKKKLYLQANAAFSTYSHITHDCVIIHDPQPLPLIQHYPRKQPWVWRVHIDLSNPNKDLWEFLKSYVLKYDVIIISSEDYRLRDTPVEQRIIQPAIDPLSPKNMKISEKDIAKYLKKFNIPTDKPIITQISRFDRFKDQEGLIDIFRIVKEEVDCRLVLCGSMALDDPESQQYYERTRRKANNHIKNRDVILITSENNILVNALQRVSNVIVQKSLREGFGLTVTEALLKKKPVVASNVGGIKMQISDGETGFLVEPDDRKAFAQRVIELLKNPSMAKTLGENAHEVVKKNFLITRLLRDYLDLLQDLIG